MAPAAEAVYVIVPSASEVTSMLLSDQVPSAAAVVVLAAVECVPSLATTEIVSPAWAVPLAEVALSLAALIGLVTDARLTEMLSV